MNAATVNFASTFELGKSAIQAMENTPYQGRKNVNLGKKKNTLQKTAAPGPIPAVSFKVVLLY